VLLSLRERCDLMIYTAAKLALERKERGRERQCGRARALGSRLRRSGYFACICSVAPSGAQHIDLDV
jgi:hypothetical protein